MNSSDNLTSNSHNQQVVDFDIHGVVGVRMINPSVGDTKAFLYQMGELKTTLKREPDIIVHFREQLSPSGLKYLGLNSTAYTDEGFFLIGKGTGEVDARIPFESIGDQCEVFCRRGLGSVPLLSDIIKFTALKKNFVPLHASAFLYNQVGVLTTGWAKGGKTEALLSFANHGAQYIGDEWVLLSHNDKKILGLPVNIAIWDWQFKFIPELMPRISIQKKIVFAGIHFLDAVNTLLARRRLSGFYPAELLNQAMPFLKRGLRIKIPPHVIFKNQASWLRAPLDIVFLMMSHDGPEIKVEPWDPVEIARCMVNSNEYEQFHFFEYYKAFKFAFPHRQNKFLEKVNELQRSLLCRALVGKRAYKVLHPYPVPFEALFAQMRPYCENVHEHALL